MSSMTRIGSLLSLSCALALLAGCGSSDSGGVIVPGASTGGAKNGTGGKTSIDGSAAGGASESGGAGYNGGAGNSGGSNNGGGAGAPGDGSSGAPGAGGTTTGMDSGAGGDVTDASFGAGGNGNTGGAGGANTGGKNGAGGASSTCGGVKCDATATCTSNKCVCPAGTTDKNGNGTKCTNPNGGTCTVDGDCTNSHCVGGSCCGVACTTPGTCHQVAGTVCANGNTCQYGKQLDGTTCDDGNACTTSSCFDGTCTVDTTKTCTPTSKCETQACNAVTGNCDSTPIVCNDNNACTTDTCDVSTGCVFTPNTNACNDNNACTSGDKCTSGTCKGTAVNCNDNNVCTNDACSPATGCTHTNNTATCDDGSACTPTDKCSAGKCVGSGNACGALSTACTPCTGSPAPAGCYEPTPPQGRDCTCLASSNGTPVIEKNGVCLLNTDECAANPCGTLSTGCIDPTPAAPASGDYQCTCVQGTTGNTVGKACQDLNECTAGPNPCGAGTCTNASPPTFYTCTCPTGYKSTKTTSGPVCACDMTGTWAEVVTTLVSWKNVGFGTIKDGTNVPTYGWSLRQQTIASDGTLSITTVPCGGIAPTLCQNGGTTAYSEYQPVASWGLPRMRSGIPTIGPIDVSGTLPGGSYAEPLVASLLGMDLQDPLGTWPPCAGCATGGPSPAACSCTADTNPATWWVGAEVPNEPSATGVATYVVLPGGSLIDGTHPDPPVNYGLPSPCGGDYSAIPGPPLSGYNVQKVYGASRIRSALSSTSVTFDATAKACSIAGNVTGPNGATVPATDARIAGCVPTAGTTCNSDFYDGIAQSQTISKSTFTLDRITLTKSLATILAETEGATKDSDLAAACQQVRVKNCPAGYTCQ